MTIKINTPQVAEKSILDLAGRQTYLGNSFVAAIPSAGIGATTETPYALIINPATNSKSMYNFLKRMYIVTTTATIATFRFYAVPTVTSNGTPVTPHNLRFNAGSPSSTMNIYSLPTVSSNGTFLAEIGSTSSGNPSESNLLSILDPGSTVLITVTASSGTVPVGFETAWYEL